MTKRLKSIVLALVLGLSLIALGGCGAPPDGTFGSSAAPIAASAL